MTSGLIDSETFKKIADMYREFQSLKQRFGQISGQTSGQSYVNPGNSLRVVITTEDISPNTYGGFKFTTGAKGSETATGDEYQGFYRNAETDPPDLPSGTLCYAMWVPCDSLGDGETGWELTPIACLDA